MHRLLHAKAGTVYALTRDLDAWRSGRDVAFLTQPAPASEIQAPKDPAERWQSAADNGRELASVAGSKGAEAARPSASNTGPLPVRRTWRPGPIVVAGAIVALVVVAMAGRWIGSRETAHVATPVIRSSLELPPDGALVHGSRTSLAVSPDGMRLAWIGQSDSSQPSALYVMSLSDGPPRESAAPRARNNRCSLQTATGLPSCPNDGYVRSPLRAD